MSLGMAGATSRLLSDGKMLKLEDFNTVAKLIGKRRSLLDFLQDCTDAKHVRISVPQKGGDDLSLTGRNAVVTDRDNIEAILAIAETEARQQLKDIEAKILRYGLELPC
jgi:hypothetical protein